MNINIFHFSDLSSAAFTLPMQTIDVWFFKQKISHQMHRIRKFFPQKNGTGLPVIHRGKTVSSIRLRAFSYVCCLENICTSHRKNLCFVQAHMANFIWIMMHLQSEVWDICHGFPLISLIRKSRLRLHFPFLPRSVSTSKKYVKMHAAATLSTVSFTRMKNCDSHIYRSGKVHSFFSVTGRYEKHF